MVDRVRKPGRAVAKPKRAPMQLPEPTRAALARAAAWRSIPGAMHTRVIAIDGLPLQNASRTVEMWIYSIPETWKAERHLYQYGSNNPREAAYGMNSVTGPIRRSIRTTTAKRTSSSMCPKRPCKRPAGSIWHRSTTGTRTPSAR